MFISIMVAGCLRSEKVREPRLSVILVDGSTPDVCAAPRYPCACKSFNNCCRSIGFSLSEKSYQQTWLTCQGLMPSLLRSLPCIYRREITMITTLNFSKCNHITEIGTVCTGCGEPSYSFRMAFPPNGICSDANGRGSRVVQTLTRSRSRS